MNNKKKNIDIKKNSNIQTRKPVITKAVMPEFYTFEEALHKMTSMGICREAMCVVPDSDGHRDGHCPIRDFAGAGLDLVEPQKSLRRYLLAVGRVGNTPFPTQFISLVALPSEICMREGMTDAKREAVSGGLTDFLLRVCIVLNCEDFAFLYSEDDLLRLRPVVGDDGISLREWSD